jgi:hypothetical protein
MRRDRMPTPDSAEQLADPQDTRVGEPPQVRRAAAERLNACGGTVRPGTAGHGPLNQEPGIAYAGKTETAARQQAAAV